MLSGKAIYHIAGKGSYQEGSNNICRKDHPYHCFACMKLVREVKRKSWNEHIKGKTHQEVCYPRFYKGG